MRLFVPNVFLILLVATAIGMAQSGDLFSKAPPEIDEPLRERVAGFYQAHMDGKFREAEKFVAAGESQEQFYQMQKQRYDKCKTLRITYNKEFSEAVVTESCRGKWTIQGNTLDSEMAMSSTWKRMDGVWFWHLKPVEKAPSPFGGDFDYAAGKTTAGGDGGKKEYALGAGMPKDMKDAAQALMQSVAVDKNSVTLKSYEPSSETVTVENRMTGAVTLQVTAEGGAPGLSVKLDKTELQAGEKTTLRFEMKPKDRSPKPASSVALTVEPLGKVIPISVTFSLAPETEKALPDSLKRKR